MAILRQLDKQTYAFWCPGCKESHHVNVNVWTWNGSIDAPTFDPSFLTWADPNPNALPEYPKYRNGFRCHSFIREGKIEFLTDCTHKLAGRTVTLENYPNANY